MKGNPRPMHFNESAGVLSLPMQGKSALRVHVDSRQDAELLVDILERHFADDGIGLAIGPEELAAIVKACKHWVLSTTGGTVCNTRLAAERLVQPLSGEAETKQAILLVTLDQEITIEKCDEFICTVFNAMSDQCWFRYSMAVDMRPGRELAACLLWG